MFQCVAVVHYYIILVHYHCSDGRLTKQGGGFTNGMYGFRRIFNYLRREKMNKTATEYHLDITH